MSTRISLIGLTVAVFSTLIVNLANAQLVFSNGAFETPPVGANLPDVNGWFDSNTGAFFEQTWQSNAVFQIPSGSSVAIFSSFNAGVAGTPSPDPNDTPSFLYQSIGTANGASSVNFEFDWGNPADSGAGRVLGMTVGIYAYDGVGAFTPADGTDVRGAAGVTLLDSVSLTTGPLPAGFTSEHESVSLSLAGAGTQQLFVRFNNYLPSTTESWPYLDNVVCNLCAIPPELKLEVNRDNGNVRFNNGLGPVSLVSYTITSASGSINPDNWASIASTNGDPNDIWTEDVKTVNEITEFDPLGQGAEDGIQLGPTLSLGNGLWVKSPFEDFQAQVTILDGFNEVTQMIPVIFSGTIQTEPYMRSDFDFDGDIDDNDFATFFNNHLKTLAATVPAESYVLGDLNGDLINNVVDFGLFKQDFIAVHGEAGFAAAFASYSVPEPSAIALCLTGLLMLGSVRLKSRAPSLRMAKALCAVALATMLAPRPAEAAVVSFSPAAPTPDANDVFYFITDPLTDVQNIYDQAVGAPAADGNVNDYATYIAFDRPHQGQTFTTGGTAGFVNAVWLQHVGYTANTGEGTFYSVAGGTTVQVRITNPAQAGTAGFALANETSYPLNGLESSSIAPNGLVNTPNGTGTWIRFAFENPISVSPNTSYGFDITGLATGFFETLGSNTGSYAGGMAYNGVTPAAADNVLNPLVGDRAFFVEIDATAGNPIPETIILNIDPVTGLMGLTNSTSLPVAFDHYELRSAVGGLNSAAWNSLSSRGIDAVDGNDVGTVAGDSVGEKWTVPGAVTLGQTSTNLLAEAFVLGSTTLNPNQTILLGNGYNTSIDDLNLTGSIRRTNGVVIPLLVAYDGVPQGLLGDFNGNNVVDAADYTIWRNNLNLPEGNLLNGNGDGGTVGPSDYALWKAHFGESIGGAGASGSHASVPEPLSISISLIGLSAFVLVRRRR